jgi:hypothetical protein
MQCNAKVKRSKNKSSQCKKTISSDCPEQKYCRKHYPMYTTTTEKPTDTATDDRPSHHIENLSTEQHNIIPHVQELMRINDSMPEQRTPEWLEQRWGRLTASDAASALLISEHELELERRGIVEIKDTHQKLGKGCNCYSTIKQLYPWNKIRTGGY